MAIKNIKVSNVGQAGVAPSIIYIDTDSTRAQVSASGFLNGAAQKWGVDFSDEQLAVVTTKASVNAASKADVYRLSGSGQSWSLVAINNDAPYVIKYAGQSTTTGGAAAEAFTITGVAATDLAFVQPVDQGSNTVTVLKAVCTANTLTVTFSADPGNDAVFNYQILRAYD